MPIKMRGRIVADVPFEPPVEVEVPPLKPDADTAFDTSSGPLSVKVAVFDLTPTEPGVWSLKGVTLHGAGGEVIWWFEDLAARTPLPEPVRKALDGLGLGAIQFKLV
ncbi:hypothetical protein [Streptomyces sp. NBC_00470]|uniref:hypothetical protein n=1 Tax=Streptomyces sp. NBC_00470 TaxID=2975753 RepID=UPI0030E19864